MSTGPSCAHSPQQQRHANVATEHELGCESVVQHVPKSKLVAQFEAAKKRVSRRREALTGAIQKLEVLLNHPDPKQEKNIIEDHPDVVMMMREKLYSWWDTVKDLANKPQRIIVQKHNNENVNFKNIVYCLGDRIT